MLMLMQRRRWHASCGDAAAAWRHHPCHPSCCHRGRPLPLLLLLRVADMHMW